MAGPTVTSGLLAFVGALAGGAAVSTVVSAPPWWGIVLCALVVAAGEVGLVLLRARPSQSPSTEGHVDADPRLDGGDLESVVEESRGETDAEAAFVGGDEALVTPPPVEDEGTEPSAGRPPLSEYRGDGRTGRIPQCPDCGRFDVRFDRDENDYTFTCRACSHTWTWVAGRPWPRTTPRADLRTPEHQ